MTIEPANLEVPFSNLFTVWTFNYENHYKGLDKAAVLRFAQTISSQLPLANQASIGEIQTLRTASEFLFRNATRFSIAAFVHCMYPTHTLFGEIMLNVHKDRFNQILNQAIQAAQFAEAAKIKNQQDLEQLHQLNADNENYIEQEKSKISMMYSELRDKSLELSNFETSLKKIQQEQFQNKIQIEKFFNSHPNFPTPNLQCSCHFLPPLELRVRNEPNSPAKWTDLGGTK